MDAASQHQIKTPEEAVARIAYLSSDVIVSVQPAIGTESDFSAHLKRYAGRKDSSLVAQSADAVPDILPVRHNADPLLSVYTPIRAGKLVSVTTTSSILLPSVSHLYKLANYPRCPARLPPAADICRLFCHHRYPQLRMDLCPVRDPPGGPGHGSDCPCSGYPRRQGCHPLLCSLYL
ncbi:Sulfite reductase [NADPH] subunit beta [Fusarium falciforme]|nr:Sulfite reductase [NADPH] subunit beta [Fusarium falciforme]